LPSEFRLKTARDVLNLLAEEIAAIRGDPGAGTIEKARAVETADLTDRLEAVERTLKERKESPSCATDDWPKLTTN
jgi:hypothetical protein